MLRAGDASAIQLESRRLFLSMLCGARRKVGCDAEAGAGAGAVGVAVAVVVAGITDTGQGTCACGTSGRPR
jgi:hypothetical protein